MKFAAKLRAFCIPEWQSAYINYSFLKKYLKKYALAAQQKNCVLPDLPLQYNITNLDEFQNKLFESNEETYDNEDADISVYNKVLQNSCSKTPLLNDAKNQTYVEHNKNGVRELNVILKDFLILLDNEIKKVVKHVDKIKQNLNDVITGIEEEAKTLEADMPEHHPKRIRKSVLYIWNDIDKLEEFINMNQTALYKILKKRDKLFGVQKLAEDVSIRESILSNLTTEPEMKEKVMRLFEAANKGDRTSANISLHNFYSNFQRNMMRRNIKNNSWLMFSLGVFMTCILNLFVMMWIPASSPSYDFNEAIKLFPIFRLCMIVIILVWGIGWAAHFMDKYGVNYSFVLDIDPKCQVTSTTLFTFGSILSAIWIICATCFVADAKFDLFGLHLPYWVLPSLALFFMALCFLYPSSTFRNKYKKNVVLNTLRIFKSCIFPFKDVTLMDNIIGDVLTSLSKPLADVERIIIYFSSGTTRTMFPEADYWLRPALFCFPYYIRCMQCLGRYRATEEESKRRLHLLNMGKYIAAIAVSIVTSINWAQFGVSVLLSRLIWVISYIFTTFYMLLWDVYFDWGLMPDAAYFIRPNSQMMYPKWSYFYIASTNLLCRMTWAMNLMPIGSLNDNYGVSEVVILIISSVEIYRRCNWLTLRIENEHLRNASRYRSILWVPRKYV